MSVNKKGMMFVLSSPSGAGKTTLTKMLAEKNKNFTISISHTTRKPRHNEVNGKDYYFVNKEKFDVLIKSPPVYAIIISVLFLYYKIKTPLFLENTTFLLTYATIFFGIDVAGL